MLTRNIYDVLAVRLKDHGINADREYAKRITHAACYGGVLTAIETFVLEGLELEKPLYESIAISESNLELCENLKDAREISSEWERTEPRQGVVYLRLHISGPKNVTSQGWSLL